MTTLGINTMIPGLADTAQDLSGSFVVSGAFGPFGLIHEHRGRESDRLEDLVCAVQMLDAISGASLRRRMGALGPDALASVGLDPFRDEFRFQAGRLVDTAQSLAREAAGRLDELAPASSYFGLPNTSSRLYGFWPLTWLGTSRRLGGLGPELGSDADARELGEFAGLKDFRQSLRAQQLLHAQACYRRAPGGMP